MDIRFSEEENAFRAEVRAFLQQAWTPELGRAHRRRCQLPAGHRRMAAQAVRTRLGRARLAPIAGRLRMVTDAALHLRQRAIGHWRAGGAALRDQDGRPGDPEVRQRGAEGTLPAAHPARPGLVVPGLFRARRRLRPGGAEDARRTRRRPLHRQRLEDLDHLRAACRLDVLPGAHRGLGTPAGRHQLPADRHEDAGHPHQPDHLDRRRAQPERGVLRQRARAGGQPDRRAGQGLDLRQVAAGARAHRHRRRRRLQAPHPPAARTGAPRNQRAASRCSTTRCSRRGWPTSRSS